MNDDQAIVISLFDYTINMVTPGADTGYRCYCVDLQHPPGETRRGNVTLVCADVRECLLHFGAVKILFAFPPCTHVAVSGARWFEDEALGSLIQALQLFDASVHLAE